MKAGAISLHPVLPEKASAALADASPTELTRRDDRLVRLDLEQLGFLLEEFYRRFPALRGRERVSFLLDEIQLVPGWKRFVRRVLDAEAAEIVGADAVAGGAFYLGSTVPVMSRVVTTRTTGGTDVVAGTHTYTYAQGTARNQSIFTRPTACSTNAAGTAQSVVTTYTFLGVGDASATGSVWKIGLLDTREVTQGGSLWSPSTWCGDHPQRERLT